MYRCDRPNLYLAQPRCFTFGGRRPDEAITRELLRAVEPMAIEAALQAQRRHMEVQLDQRRIVELELQQARYEATLAERRYAACDQENRLIAAQLEKSWEAALQRVLACEQRLNAVEQAQSAERSTKNASGQRDPEMHQTRKGKQWYFGMKAHIGVDARSGLVHTVRGTAANVNDVVQANSLLHGEEADVFADAGYQGASKRPDATQDVNWHVAMRPGKRRALDKTKTLDKLIDQIERLKASVRANVEHPFRVIKRQFGHIKVRYRGLKKNTAQLSTLFALSNLWMARARLLILDGQVRPKAANAA